jgi:CO/xanthine dehydrogenase Mo-binding subunit
MTTFNVVGKMTPRMEGPHKVTGSYKYTADYSPEGTLWGKFLRSPYPHARIVSIDTSKALAHPGVHAVMTGDDIDYTALVGRKIRDQLIIAKGKVRFVGERVAAVAAEDTDIAQEALDLIEVVYEELPAVFEAEDALKPGAPIIHENAQAYPSFPKNEGAPDLPNISSYLHIHHAEEDLDAVFAKSHRVFEQTFTTQREHHGYLEANVCLVSVDQATGHADVWAAVKSPVAVRNQSADGLGIDSDLLTFHPVAMGGDFGGKAHPMDIPVAYLLSKETGRPVKFAMTNTEELTASNIRHPSTITIKTGVDKDGHFLAMQAKAFFSTGAYAGFKPAPDGHLHGVHQVGSCYRIRNLDVESIIAYTNTTPGGHVRAPGAPQAIFAVEGHVDLIAKEMGLDPAEIRRRNLLREGDTAPDGEQWVSIRALETMEGALKASGWGQAKAPNTGRGISVYERAAGGGDINITLGVDSGGKVVIHSPMPDPGQGCYTVIAQVVAEQLGIPMADISVNTTTTDGITSDSGVGASRVTYVGGQAAFQASAKIRDQMTEIASERLNESSDRVIWDRGVRVGTRHIPFVELAGWSVETLGQDMSAHVRFSGGKPEATSFSCQVADVEVDPETGQVLITKMYSSHDVGQIINPVGHQGQIEGGTIYGLGMAVTSELILDEGRLVTAHLGDYKLPSIMDLPEFETILIEKDEGPAPYGGTAIAEGANVPAPAAIANAVADAIGAPILDLPITAEKVLAILRAKAAK